jgi:hypothetical protein
MMLGTDEQKRDEARGHLPGLLILGAPKAGTTTLAAWWATHPRGFTAPEKEVRYFDMRHHLGQDWYRSRFEGMRSDQVGCDATPRYLYTAHALDRIQREIPHARLVVVLREPVARLWSHWCYFVSLGIERRPFEEVVVDAEMGLARRGVDYATFSRYLSALRQVVDRFPREQLLVLLSDELRSDRQAVMDRVAAHVGVEPAPLPEIRDQNEGRFPRSVRAQLVLRRLRPNKWPLGLGRRLMDANVRPGGPPPIDPEHRARLRELFRGDLDPLERWLERPLPRSWRQG